jgi:hypothetical protein
MAQFIALFDEWYARDVSERWKSSIAYRKNKGITVGLPPFGTKRDKKTGYLVPSEEGAWLLANGTYVSGVKDAEPESDAKWRPYFKAAERALTLYAENKRGIAAIATKLHEEGWAYRNRNGEPTFFEGGDVRRIISNWAEYGGHVSKLRARERHPFDHNIDEIALNPQRAVFPVELLYEVARVRLKRTIKPRRPVSHGIHPEAYPYPLQGIVYCAHCEESAREKGDGSLRSRLGGWTSNDGRTRRYRHKSGTSYCGCKNRSVTSDVIEKDFSRLIHALEVNTAEIDWITEMGILASKMEQGNLHTPDLEAEKLTAINKLQRKLRANRNLFEDGDKSREEYLHDKEKYEHEINLWRARTSETEKVAIELTMVIEAINKIAFLWDNGSDEDRQGWAKNLFEAIIYDIDTQRIVDFRLKPWADRFVILRGEMYQDNERITGESSTDKGLEPLVQNPNGTTSIQEETKNNNDGIDGAAQCKPMSSILVGAKKRTSA